MAGLPAEACDAGVNMSETETFVSFSAATLAVSAGTNITPQNSATPTMHKSVLLHTNVIISDVYSIFLAFHLKFSISFKLTLLLKHQPCQKISKSKTNTQNAKNTFLKPIKRFLSHISFLLKNKPPLLTQTHKNKKAHYCPILRIYNPLFTIFTHLPLTSSPIDKKITSIKLRQD